MFISSREGRELKIPEKRYLRERIDNLRSQAEGQGLTKRLEVYVCVMAHRTIWEQLWLPSQLLQSRVPQSHQNSQSSKYQQEKGQQDLGSKVRPPLQIAQNALLASNFGVTKDGGSASQTASLAASSLFRANGKLVLHPFLVSYARLMADSSPAWIL